MKAFYEARVKEQNEQYPGYAKAWRAFAARVLEEGGRHVVPPRKPDPFVPALLAEGELWREKAVQRKGRVSDCHRNAVALWQSGKARAIGTGYALSDDGLWREHTWGLAPSGSILETTEPRIGYFGIELDDEGAETFATFVGAVVERKVAPARKKRATRKQV